MAKKKKVEYAELKRELEAIISRLQSSDIEVDAALELHEQAEALIAQLEEHLEASKNVIEHRTATTNTSPKNGAGE